MRTTPIAVAAILLLSCSAARNARQSATAYTNVLIDSADKSDLYGPCEPAIAINPIQTEQIAAGAILDRYYWSNDAGKTWQKNTLKSDLGVFGDPVLIADWKGNFFYAHLSDPSGKGWGGETLLDRIAIQKSTDGGKTYDNGAFTGHRPPKDQDKHWLTADPRTNHLLCTWTEFDQYGSKDTDNDHSRILFSKSTDTGASWSAAVSISQFEGDCLDDDNTTEGAVPAFGPDGQIYVAWAWNDKIWFDRSLDGGETWLEKDILVADQPGGWSFDIPGISRCNGMPVLVCDLSDGPHRGTLYINWSDQRNGQEDTDIWMASSTDGGLNWSAPKSVNDDRKNRHQFLSWLTVDQSNGYLYLVFYDRRNYRDLRTDVYLAVSRNGGQNFENVRISEKPFSPAKQVFFGDYNHITAHKGVVRPIWTRLDNNILSIWTALIDFN